MLQVFSAVLPLSQILAVSSFVNHRLVLLDLVMARSMKGAFKGCLILQFTAFAVIVVAAILSGDALPIAVEKRACSTITNGPFSPVLRRGETFFGWYDLG